MVDVPIKSFSELVSGQKFVYPCKSDLAPNGLLLYQKLNVKTGIDRKDACAVRFDGELSVVADNAKVIPIIS